MMNEIVKKMTIVMMMSRKIEMMEKRAEEKKKMMMIIKNCPDCNFLYINILIPLILIAIIFFMRRNKQKKRNVEINEEMIKELTQTEMTD